MSDPTPEEVRKSIVPKSDQLNADDLLVGPITVTIDCVRRGDKDQPIIIDLAEDYQPYKPCKSMRRVLIGAYSDDPKKWIGQQVTLFCDPTVTWAGVKVGGIRISHLSGIGKTKVFMLTQTRGKKAEIIIQPLAAPKPPEPTEKERLYIDEITKMIAAVTTLEELANLGVMMADKSAPIKEALRGLYGARKAELQSKVLEPGG